MTTLLQLSSKQFARLSCSKRGVFHWYRAGLFADVLSKDERLSDELKERLRKSLTSNLFLVSLIYPDPVRCILSRVRRLIES